MGLPSYRLLVLHRLMLLPPFVLLMFWSFYTSSTLAPFSTGTQHLSFLEGMQCSSCASSSPLTYRSFLSRTLTAFPTSFHIRGIVLGHNDLNEEDSRGEAEADELASGRHTDEVENAGGWQSNENKKPAQDNQVTADTVSGAGEKSAAVEFFSEKESFHGSKIVEEVERTVPEGNEAHSSVETVKVPSESKDNFGEPSNDDLRLGSRPFTSGDHSRHSEHAHTPIENNVSTADVVPGPPPSKQSELADSGLDTVFAAQRNAVDLADKLAKSGLPTQSVNSSYAGYLDVNVPLRGESPQGVPLPQRSCEGRRAYVYTLPSKFNVDLAAQCDLVHWFSVCDYFVNEGMGQKLKNNELNDRGEKVLVPDGSWYMTHQYALELTFHSRLMYHPCLTEDANQADLFFVPYYAGLDVARYQFRDNVTNEQQDELMLELMSWLEGQDSWSRNNGVDHVFVLGKIGWDFRRVPSGHWGSRFLTLPSMEKPTKVLIERDPFHEQDIGVPHPTFFHPKDDNEIRTWLTHVEQSERRSLVSFAGMPRPNMSGNVRVHLIQQCLDHEDDCSLLRCVGDTCMRPDQTMNLFLHSHFCMQPPGDSPTRRSVFDSLVGGCIPVLFHPLTAYGQYPWHLPRNFSSYSVYIPSENVISGKVDIVRILKSVSPEERTAMRTRIIREIIPGLLYAQPGTNHSDFRDAFDISLEGLFHRVANMRAEKRRFM